MTETLFEGVWEIRPTVRGLGATVDKLAEEIAELRAEIAALNKLLLAQTSKPKSTKGSA